jgi:hypothetical protein
MSLENRNYAPERPAVHRIVAKKGVLDENVVGEALTPSFRSFRNGEPGLRVRTLTSFRFRPLT